jgi:hypothetical protein
MMEAHVAAVVEPHGVDVYDDSLECHFFLAIACRRLDLDPMTKQLWKITVIVLSALVFSGWLLPLWLAVDFYLGYINAQSKNLVNTFPFITAARQCAATAMGWLGLVIFCWRVREGYKRERTK